MSLTHIAAQDITVAGRYKRQRCAWCGKVLMDYDFTRTAVEGTEWVEPGAWPAGALVREDDAIWVVLEDTPQLPDDACALLHPELTL